MSTQDHEIYSGRIVSLKQRFLELGDGRRVMREIVEHAPGSAVVAIEDDGNVLLVRQHRPAVDAYLLELPAGLLDPGETPEECARRELAEETGYSARRLEPLVSFYTSPGFSTELIHVFVATELVEARTAHDEEEEIELVRLPLDDAIFKVTNQELSDAKTVAGLMAFARMRGEV